DRAGPARGAGPVLSARFSAVLAGAAAGAQAPEGHVGLVDQVAGLVHRLQARRVPDGAVDVLDGPAVPAHQVVVVVADAPLEPGGAVAGLDRKSTRLNSSHVK